MLIERRCQQMERFKSRSCDLFTGPAWFNVQNVDAENQRRLDDTGDALDGLAQHPFRPASVFNFYRPGYIAPGNGVWSAKRNGSGISNRKFIVRSLEHSIRCLNLRLVKFLPAAIDLIISFPIIQRNCRSHLMCQPCLSILTRSLRAGG